MVDYNLDKRKYVIGGVAIAIVVIYAIRLFTLQIMSEDYKKNADSNAFQMHSSMTRPTRAPGTD